MSFECKPVKIVHRDSEYEVWVCNHDRTHLRIMKATKDVKAGEPIDIQIDGPEATWEIGEALKRSYDTIMGID